MCKHIGIHICIILNYIIYMKVFSLYVYRLISNYNVSYMHALTWELRHDLFTKYQIHGNFINFSETFTIQ